MTERSIDVVLIRHGQSEWNVESRHQGHAGTGLSELGQRQARELADHLREVFGTVHAIVSSDLQRTRETAAPYLEASGLEARYDRSWREIDSGAWAGLLPTDVAALYPDEVAAMKRGLDIARGGGETVRRLRERVWAAMTELADRSWSAGATAPVLVFTHGGPISVAAAQALGLPPMGNRWLAPPANCSLSRFRHRYVGGERISSELIEFAAVPERVAAEVPVG